MNVYGVILVLLFLPSLAFAAPVGSPELLEEGATAIDVVSSYTFERDLAATNVTDEKVENAHQSYLRFTRNMAPFFDLYGNIGVSDLAAHERWETGEAFYLNTEFREEYGYGIFGGGGGKFAAEIYPESGWWAGLDIQTNWARMPIRDVVRAGESSSAQSGRMTVREIQITALLSKRMSFGSYSVSSDYGFVPYGGVKLSWYDMEGKINFTIPSAGTSSITTDSVGNKDKTGFIGGFEVDWRKELLFQVEGTFFDDLSLSGSLRWAF
ncbi:MAG: hypothetical protein ABH845_04995 [Candidatus Omnitrophota bacterium]